MTSKWESKDFVICGVFAALTFAASFLLGSAITAAAGPGMSGLATIIVTTLIVVVGARIVDKFGAMILMVLLFSLFAIPTTMFGPPGPHKLLVGLVTGVTYDATISVFRRHAWGYRLAGGIGAVVAIFAIWALLASFKLPGTERYAHKIATAIHYLAPIYFLLGVVGGHLGVWFFDKSLKDLAVVKSLRRKTSDDSDQ